jgi:soluble lytic murein transglycosylase
MAVTALLAGPPAPVDLTPIPLSTRPAEDARARALIAQRQWSEAAALVTGDVAERRFVRAWLHHRAGESAQVIAALAGSDLPAPLKVRGRVLAGYALLSLDQPRLAAAQVEGLPAEGPAGREARRVHARALRESGQTGPARAAYEVLIETGDGEDTPVGLLGLARLEMESGQPEATIALLTRLRAEYPVHWTARSAERLADEVVAKRPALAPAWESPGTEAVLDRAEALLARYRNKAVVAALEPLAKAPAAGKLAADHACRLNYALGRALRNMRKWRRATRIIGRAVESCDAARDEDRSARSRYLAGAAAERLSKESNAATHFTRLLDSHPDHRLADDAGFFLVRHFIEDKKDWGEARSMAKRLVKALPLGDMVSDAVFFVALHGIIKGDAEGARAVLDLDDVLPPRDPWKRDAGRADYWRARLDLDLGRTEAAMEGLESVIATYPFSWYAMMAFSRMREVDPDRALAAFNGFVHAESRPPAPPGADRETALLPPEGLDPARLEEALLLARLGLADDARATLGAAGLTRNAPDSAWWFAVRVLDAAGAHHLSHDILRRRLGVFRRFPPAGETRELWEIAYPRPFADLVHDHAKKNGLQPWFVWGIMREESGFRPAAESWANAMGLMQLIMPTAKRMARKAEGPITRAALQKPALNITLGTRYLGRIRERFDGFIPLFPGSYNAGAGAMSRWVKRRGDLPLDLFVEAIPYNEARGYTKRVLASWATHRYLYGKPPADEPLPYLRQNIRADAPKDLEDAPPPG